MKYIMLFVFALFACQDDLPVGAEYQKVTTTTKVVNVVDFGANPADDGGDDSLYIRDAVAALPEGGVVYFPAGVYQMRKVQDVATVYIGTGQAKYTFVGDGQHSVIFSEPGDGGGYDWFVFRLVEAEKVVFKDLAFNGNRYNQVNRGEQTHAIMSQKVQDLVVDNVWFYDQWGDAVKFLGEPGYETNRTTITNCRFWGQRRNAITLQRLSRWNLISNNVFHSVNDSAIDFEPTGGSPLADTLITGNVIDDTDGTTVSVSLTNASNVQFVNNRVVGAIHSVNLKHSIISNNLIDSRTGPIVRPALDLIRKARSVIISNNTMYAPWTTSAMTIAYNNGESPNDIKVTSNIFEARTGVNITGGSNLNVTDNIIRAGDDGISVNALAIGAPIERLIVSDNVMSGGDIAVNLQARNYDMSATLVGNQASATVRLFQAGQVNAVLDYVSGLNTWD